MMTQKNKLLQGLDRTDALCFPGNRATGEWIQKIFSSLKSCQSEGATYWFENDRPSVANTRIKQYPTGHTAFYRPDGRRFLTVDPDGHPLNEAEWTRDENSGESRLQRARMQLDCRLWVGIQPRAKTFQTQIDIKGQPGWEEMTLDGLREKAAEVWRVPFSEVKYFYKDENMIPLGDGKYDIRLTKDGLYGLADGTFDNPLFISFMFTVNWEKLDLIPVVELFQSTLPGSGGAVFEFIWGLYEDQSRDHDLGPLRYRGLPTYPSREAFNIFSAFFTPRGPEGDNLLKIFMNPDRSHEIEWRPKANPPWRYFSDEQGITLTVQDHFLYKVTVHEDPVPIPYVNCARGGRPSCERELRAGPKSFVLVEGEDGREIPYEPKWQIAPWTDAYKPRPPVPFHWTWFFNGFPPKVDPVKVLFTVPFYPEGAEEIQEASLQPLALDQIFYYMEMSPGMPEKLKSIQKVLIHTFDMVIAGCVDCTREREYTVLYSDPEFAQKNACLLWNYAMSRNQLENLKKVSFLPEKDHIEEVYREKYGLIFKWIPFLYHQDREACEDMLHALVNALQPEGILFLVGPRPIQGLFEHYHLDCWYHDPVANMPFFRQHLKMCPENQVNPDVCVFLLEKKPVPEARPAPAPAADAEPQAPSEKPKPGEPVSVPPLRSFPRRD